MVVLSSIQIYLLCQDGLTFRTFDALLQKGGETDLNAKKNNVCSLRSRREPGALGIIASLD